jgi:hypothetical protein
MKILATKNGVVGRFGRPTNAKKPRAFPPDCGQKARLSRVYDAAAKHHRCVVGLLTSPLAPLNESEHTKVYVRVELAKLEVEDARKALVRHVTEHGC